MNAHAITALGLARTLTGTSPRRTEHGEVVASAHGPRGSRYIVSVRGQWFSCKQEEKDSILLDGNTDGLTPMTDDECDAADRGDW